MPPNECVIDSDLFQKICSDDVKYRNINELLKFKLDSKQISIDDCFDFKCFKDLLNEVKIYRLTLGVNNKIKKEYIEFAMKWPKDDLFETFRNILSKQGCFQEITKNLDDTSAKSFSNTPLESKLDYIAVASSLKHRRIIVASHNEIEQKYEKCCSELMELGIDWTSPCTAKDKLIYAEPVTPIVEPIIPRVSPNLEESEEGGLVMNIEERATKAEDFLNGMKNQVFGNKIFSSIYTDIGNLEDDFEEIVEDLNTQLKGYREAKKRAKKYSGNIIYKSEYQVATKNLEAVLSDYEKLCIAKIFPTLKQKLIDLPNKINEGKIQLNQAESMEQTIAKPPPELKIKPEATVTIDPSGDKRVNAFKEKINRALEWIEVPLNIGKGAGKFLSENGSTIVSAASGVLKMLAIL
jgi:hypothetical protein